MQSSDIKKAISNMGGATRAGNVLQVSTNTVHKWIRNGVIPNIVKAKRVAEESGFDLWSLRPRYIQEVK